MAQVIAFAVFALLLARLMRAPAGTWRYVLGAAAAALIASQFLPAGHPFREDVASSAGTLFWVAIGLAPVLAYAVVVRGLRRRLGVDAAMEPPKPRGLVQFAEDRALAAETAAALEGEALPAERLSLGWRGADGALEGHLRLALRSCGGAAPASEIELLRVAPEARGRGIGRALVEAAEREAAARGAGSVGALVPEGPAARFFAARGYVAGAAAGARRWMEKPL